MNWIDVAAGAFLLFSAWNGFRRGLINELTGFVALIVALGAAFAYNGQLDGVVATLGHLGSGSAHVAGLLAFASIAYLIVWSIGLALGRIAKLPVLNVVNGALGSALAIGKTVAILVVVDYLVTLAPMSDDLRHDVNGSFLGRSLGAFDASIDASLGDRFVPPYLRSLWDGATHHRDGSPSQLPSLPTLPTGGLDSP